MRKACPHCGDASTFAVIAPGDFERTFDYQAEWQGLRLLCPGCGALLAVNYGRVALTNAAVPGVPEGFVVHATVGPGPEVIPFPQPKADVSPPSR